MGALDPFTPPEADGAGVVLPALNPKNAGMAAIAQTGSSTGAQVVALVAFALIASIGVAAPVVVYFALGDRSARASRPPEELAGPQQRRDHGWPGPDPRRQADRRRDLGLLLDGPVQPFTAPAVMPRMKNRWPARYSSSIGIVAQSIPAITSGTFRS